MHLKPSLSNKQTREHGKVRGQVSAVSRFMHATCGGGCMHAICGGGYTPDRRVSMAKFVGRLALSLGSP
jgi:hypothetical protein